jgi:hypothetical protein
MTQFLQGFRGYTLRVCLHAPSRRGKEPRSSSLTLKEPLEEYPNSSIGLGATIGYHKPGYPNQNGKKQQNPQPEHNECLDRASSLERNLRLNRAPGLECNPCLDQALASSAIYAAPEPLASSAIHASTEPLASSAIYTSLKPLALSAINTSTEPLALSAISASPVPRPWVQSTPRPSLGLGARLLTHGGRTSHTMCAMPSMPQQGTSLTIPPTPVTVAPHLYHYERCMTVGGMGGVNSCHCDHTLVIIVSTIAGQATGPQI